MSKNLLTDALLQRCSAVATSTWSDALDQLGIAGVIEGLALQSGSGCVAGSAVTVRETAGPLGRNSTGSFNVGAFIDVLGEGNILVIDMGGAMISSFGGLAAQAARKQRAMGVVINGGCRDVADIRASGLWVRSRHVTPVSGKGRVQVKGVNVPITVCGIQVNPGDCIIGDETGLICVAGDKLIDALTVAEGLRERDERFSNALSDGHSFGSTAARLKHL